MLRGEHPYLTDYGLRKIVAIKARARPAAKETAGAAPWFREDKKNQSWHE